MEKRALRQEIRRLKAQHTETELRLVSEEICRSLLSHPRVRAAGTVLAYWALADEVCTHRLLDELLAQGKTVLLPKVVSGTDMTLHRYTGPDSLAEGAFGIMEPKDGVGEFGVSERGSVAIVPGMAFDKAGHRLGRGKGYYDRLLARSPYLYKIGVCFPFQFLEDVPSDDHDVVMDEVISFVPL